MEVIQLPVKSRQQTVDRLWAHPDGKTLIMLTGRGTQTAALTWWDLAAGRPERTVNLRPFGPGWHVAFAPDLTRFQVGSTIFDIYTKSRITLPIPDAPVGRYEVSAADFGAGGATLYGLLWNREQVQVTSIGRWSLDGSGAAFHSMVYSSQPSFDEITISPDGQILMVGSTQSLFGRKSLSKLKL